MKAAVVDLGFNSVKMVCYNVDREGAFRAYRQDAFRARLGEGLDETGFLGVAQMQRTIGYLRMLSEIASMESIDRVIPIATSAVREASNGPQFVRSVMNETRLSFRVISAREEGLYSFAGAMTSTNLSDVVFFDLGGGSLEIVRSSGFKIQKVVSLPLGVLRLSFEYGDGKGTFSKRQARLMKKRIVELLPTQAELRLSARTRLVGVGGTVRAMARRDQEFSPYPFTKMQSHSVPYPDVNLMSKELVRMSRKELGDEREIGNRADTIVAGTVVVKMLMKALGMRSLTVSARGLREGVLSMYLQNPKSFHKGSVSLRDVERFVRGLGGRTEPASNGYPLLFERARLVDRREAELLREALRLIPGAPPSVNLQGLFYSILEEESPASKHDQLMIAATAVAVRNDRVAELMMKQYEELLDGKDRASVKRLALIYSFVETLKKVEADLKISRRGGDLSMRVAEGKAPLPVSLLTHQAEAIGEVDQARLNLAFVPRSESGPVASEVGQG